MSALFTARDFTPAALTPPGDPIFGDQTLVKLRYRKDGVLYGHLVLVMPDDRTGPEAVAFGQRIREAARAVGEQVGVPVEYALVAGSDTEWRPI